MNPGAETRPNPHLPWPALALLPHRPPLLLVQRLVARSGQCAVAEAVLPVNGLFAEGAGVLAEYSIELVAQTAALGNSYDRALAGAGPGRGMIVGVDGFTWPGRAPGGRRVLVSTEVASVFGPMKVVRGEVRLQPDERADRGNESSESSEDHGGTLLAAGDVKVWEEGGDLPSQGPSEAEKERDMGDCGLQADNSTTLPGLAAALDLCCQGWQEEEAGGGLRRGRIDYLFPAAFPGFVGHFPGNPLLPAVLQLAAVRHGAGRLLGMEGSPLCWEKVKFKGMIRPGDPVSFALAASEERGALVVDFTARGADGGILSSGRLRLLRYDV